MPGGGVLVRPTSSPRAGPPVSASTLRTSAGISTGLTNRPLPSWARASSGVGIAPPGRATKSTWMSSASGSSRIRATTSSAPSLSASTRTTRGCCTATRATSIDRGTSTTVYPAPRSARATPSASAVGSLTKTVAAITRAASSWGVAPVTKTSPPVAPTPETFRVAGSQPLSETRQPSCAPDESEQKHDHRELAVCQREHRFVVPWSARRDGLYGVYCGRQPNWRTSPPLRYTGVRMNRVSPSVPPQKVRMSSERSGRISSRWTRWTELAVRNARRLAVAAALLAVVSAVGLWLVVQHYEAGLPRVVDLKAYHAPQVTRVLARDAAPPCSPSSSRNGAPS